MASPVNIDDLDAFTRSYIECALWSSNDESDERGGEPLDRNYDIDDIAPEALAIMAADCAKFQADNAADIVEENYVSGKEYTVEEMAGHDFWLTRHGHGAGFWDGDWEDEAGKRLSDAADAFPECDLIVGDDGQIHI